jgi:hypothetical protein
MKNKILASFVVLVLGLAMVGVSYAAWTSSVQMKGNASVGTIDLKYLACAKDRETSPSANPSWVYSDTDHTITITLTNVYPGYKVDLGLTLANGGTLPLYFDTFQMTYCSSTPLAAWFSLGFYSVHPTTFNVGPINFNYYATLHDYQSSWGISEAAVTLAPGASGTSWIQIAVDPTMPAGFMGETLVVTFQLAAALAVPT